MIYSIIDIYKIIYSPMSKKYKIIFNTSDNKQEFSILLNNNYAKNVAMASENISSVLLSQYELFINLLTQLDLKISKVFIKKSSDGFNTLIRIYSRKDDTYFNLNSYIGDATILALKSFVNIAIEKGLLNEKKKNNINPSDEVQECHHYPEEIRIDRKSNESKILMLQTALDDCLVKENYESAAFLRDRINILNKDK